MRYNLLLCFFVFTFTSCGRKIAPPDNEVRSSLDLDIEDGIKVITYNIKALGKKPIEQTQELISYIRQEEFDIVLLQEVFHEKTRELIINELGELYPSMMTRVDYGGWHSLWEDAGLMILSKYKLVDISNLILPKDLKNKGTFFHKMLDKEVSVAGDAFANKSVAGVVLERPDGKMIIAMTTHAQAIGTKKTKVNQLKEMRYVAETVTKQITENNIALASELSVIISGDFNIDAYVLESDYQKLLKHLGNPIDLYQHHSPTAKEYSFSAGIFNMLLRFDYIFSWDILDGINLSPLRAQEVKISDVKSNGVSISDHYPIITTLR